MEAIKTEVEFLEISVEAEKKAIGDVVTELNDLALALVGGGSGDVCL
jgi:hypothetical protein